MSLFIGPSLIFLYELVYFFNRYTGYLSRGNGAIDATRSQVTLVMTLVERTAGAPLGLYTASLATTLYLMLPMFNGADVVFRNALVPLAGQREALLLKDAKMLAKTMCRQLPASRHGEAREAIAEAFLVEAKMQK